MNSSRIVYIINCTFVLFRWLDSRFVLEAWAKWCKNLTESRSFIASNCLLLQHFAMQPNSCFAGFIEYRKDVFVFRIIHFGSVISLWLYFFNWTQTVFLFHIDSFEFRSVELKILIGRQTCNSNKRPTFWNVIIRTFDVRCISGCILIPLFSFSMRPKPRFSVCCCRFFSSEMYFYYPSFSHVICNLFVDTAAFSVCLFSISFGRFLVGFVCVCVCVSLKCIWNGLVFRSASIQSPFFLFRSNKPMYVCCVYAVFFLVRESIWNENKEVHKKNQQQQEWRTIWCIDMRSQQNREAFVFWRSQHCTKKQAERKKWEKVCILLTGKVEI